MTRLTDRRNLTKALLAVKTSQPTATAVVLTTSDQNTYGFWLTDVTLPGGSLRETDPEALDVLSDTVWDMLCDLDWNGVVGEDRHGNATVSCVDVTDERPARVIEDFADLKEAQTTWDTSDFTYGDSPEDIDHDNRRRASFAARAVLAYAERVGHDTLETAVSDMLSDLRHLCDRISSDDGEPLDFDVACTTRHYEAEIVGKL